MMRKKKTFVCKNCGKSFDRDYYREYQFCSNRCSALYNKPSQHLFIHDLDNASLRTKYRRRAKKGETQPVFRYPFNEEFFFKWSDELA